MSARRPNIGARVMRVYGRKDYAEYGEIGTVTAHNGNGTFQMTLDAAQPFYREMWGSKAKPTDHGGMVHKVLTPHEVTPLAKVYRENARRLRAVAKTWADMARRVESEARS
ncbi:hypothetical protein QE418_000562 [Microbacterium testaceum]|uniref:hypothetical protein n=1 Tax=Microbacterium TaxID=33882 RepID=UPI0027820E44|nr:MULTISPECIES: hypothetical protein [Microbacterium]MDQ1111114.1 hypothetical protein [Microbacterium testaceum]MDR6098347.1 hypothetical protein [Microbacterium sp. SORGH_AS_0454]